jgi:hypothetical protein
MNLKNDLKNTAARIWHAALCLMLASSAVLACGSADVYNDSDLGPVLAGEDEGLGTVEQAIGTSQTTMNGVFSNPKSYVLGVSSLTGIPGAQAYQSQSTTQQVNVPNTHSWSVRFSGFAAGAELTRVTNDATAAESVLTNNIGVGSTWFHVGPTIGARIQITKLADDGLNDKSTIDKLASVVCSQGSVLSEPTAINGVFRALSTSTSPPACTVGIRLAKIQRLVSGSTPQDRVIKHAISWALAGIAGAGDTAAASLNSATDVTHRQVNENITKASMPSGQVCLLSHWCGDAAQEYKLDFACGFFCDELPLAY